MAIHQPALPLLPGLDAVLDTTAAARVRSSSPWSATIGRCLARSNSRRGAPNPVRTPGVDHRAQLLIGENLIKRKAQVADTSDRLLALGRPLQAPDKAEDLAAPPRTVAADMLQVQTGIAVTGPVGAKVTVAPPRDESTPGKVRTTPSRWLR